MEEGYKRLKIAKLKQTKKKNGDDVVFEWPILTLANNQDQLPTIIIKKVKR